MSVPAPISENAAYSTSRSGARASRGFGYQHAVTAWVCSKVAVGDLAATDVIPEGLEDTQVTGTDPVFIQVKSRQASQGDFSVSQVLGFLRTMINTRAAQPREPLSERLVLVLERPIDGAQSVQWGQSLADLEPSDPIRVGAEDLFGRVVEATEGVSTLLGRTAVVVLPWGQLDDDTRTGLAVASGLPVGATEPLLHTLRHEVSQCTSQNASPNLADRRTLGRQSIQRLITETAQLIDINSLTTALSTGRCVPVDFDTPIDDPRFFEGIDVRPGHVVAGLPAPRTELVEFASDSLRSKRAVLVTGPSGVGKSTVMWSTAYAMRDVVWYEVTRLERGDEEDVWRLLVSLRPTPSSPIGLIVDSIGARDPAAWDALRDRLPADGSVLMLGSVRTEDLSMLAGARNAAVVECRMDELVARELFEGLRANGRTSLQTWEDAYEASNNLTMEFTYMLTQGQRLSAVLAEQVRRREHEGRSIEIDVLRLVSSAARWGARVPADCLTAIAPESASRSEALRRLIGEHLIELDGVHYGGLHQLRASVVSAIVHETPPPTLEATAVELARVVDPPDLRSLVLGCLLEKPEAAPAVIEALRERVLSGADCSLITIVLRALRAADFRRDGGAWACALDKHAVAQAYRPVTVWLAITDSDTEMPEATWKPGIGASIRDMKAAPQKTEWRDAFIGAVGSARVRELAGGARSLAEVEALLGALQGATGAPELARMISASPAVAAFIADAAPPAASRFLGLLGALDAEAARSLRENLGSDEWAKTILLSLHPWIVHAVGSTTEGGELELEAELLYGGDWFGIDPHEQAVEAARTLLNLYPECTVRVRTINAAGDLLAYKDHEPGRSQLLRKYNQHPFEISWNRERARLVLQLAMRRSDAERALAVTSLIPQVDRFFSEVTSAWVRQNLSRQSMREFASVQQSLIQANDALPARSAPDIGDAVDYEPSKSDPDLLDNDDFHALVDGICSNVVTRLLEKEEYNSLAAYVGDTVLKLVPKARAAESWRESRDSDPIVALANIERTLHDLRAVLADIAYGQETKAVVLGAASSAGRNAALSKCAERAIQRATHRLGERLDRIVSEAATRGLSVRWVLRDSPKPSALDWPAVEVAFIVDVDSIGEWDIAASTLQPVLSANGTPIDLGHPILAPALHGHPVPALAMRFGSVLFPAAEAALGWGTAVGTTALTPTADALQRLWGILHAASSLTLRARLRDEPHALDDMPGDLVTQMATAVGEVQTQLAGSALEEAWSAWRAEAVQLVVSEAGRSDLDSHDVWVAKATPRRDSESEVLTRYLLLWVAVLEFDLQRSVNSTPETTG